MIALKTLIAFGETVGTHRWIVLFEQSFVKK